MQETSWPGGGLEKPRKALVTASTDYVKTVPASVMTDYSTTGPAKARASQGTYVILLSTPLWSKASVMTDYSTMVLVKPMSRQVLMSSCC